MTLYIDSKYEIPHIYFMGGGKVVIFSQYGERKVIDSSYDNVHFLVVKYFDSNQLEI